MQTQSLHVYANDKDTQCVKTKSVSCDTRDINIQSQGGGNSIQSFQKGPYFSQFDQGYFTTTPREKERAKQVSIEMPLDSEINFTPEMKSRNGNEPNSVPTHKHRAEGTV